MSGPRTLALLLGPVRRRQWVILVALMLPWGAAVVATVWRLLGSNLAVPVALGLLGAAIVFAYARSLRFDAAWLTRALDAAVPELDDSSALLMRSEQALSGLQALQYQRVSARMARIELPDLRATWPHLALAFSWTVGGALLILAVVDLWPVPGSLQHARIDSSSVRGGAKPFAHILQARIRIQPPAYTGLPPRSVDGLAARVPVDSILQWSIQVSPATGAVALTTRDDKRLPLAFANDLWSTQIRLSGSMLYRIEAADWPALDRRLHRIDAVPDQTPRVRIVAPARTLNIAAPAQRSLEVSFEALDDYAIASARLLVTLAQGSGENIGVRIQSIPITGSGPPGRRRYTRSLDLAALGMQAGDDLIAQLHVQDNRAPRAQAARSASVILRWPAPASAESSAMEGLVQRVLPAYFRSQRQIIIDSEALLKEKGALAADLFVQRSDSIGVDQRVLRLRYGQFLGEESEGGSRPRSQSGHDQSTADIAASSDAAALFADTHAHAVAARAGDDAALSVMESEPGHDEAKSNDIDAATSGNAAAVTAEFGHTHDIAEAATLLDPATQKLLRAALGEMWQAELHLRQGFPNRALPFENRALGLIKQVQQADRIYLAKAGLETPPIEEARRLTGTRDGLRDRVDTLGAVPLGREALRELWMELGRERASARASSLQSSLADAEKWLLSQEPQTADVLDVMAAIDSLRLDIACEPCRRRLRASVWPLLPRPAANVSRRSGPDVSGRVYLDALASERQP